jgi:hypothetical protein
MSMSESELDLSSPEVQQQVQGLNPNIRAALNRLGDVERSRLQAEARVAQVERELAVRDAGIPDSPMRALFMKAYDGPSDVEAIKAEAEKYGLLGAHAVGEQLSPQVQQELAAQRQIVGASAGGQVPAVGEDLATALRNARTPAEVLAIVAQAPVESRIGLPGSI